MSNPYVAIWKEDYTDYYVRYYLGEYGILYDVVYENGNIDYGQYSDAPSLDYFDRRKKDYEDRGIKGIHIYTDLKEMDKFLMAEELKK